jgi:hypothetical protein
MTQPILALDELIRDIPGYEGLYAITSHSHVWSLPRMRIGQNQFGSFSYFRPGRRLIPVLSTNNGKSTYYSVHLFRDGTRSDRKIASLMTDTFPDLIPNDDPIHKVERNHIDGNKLNNHHSNIEWTTPLGNVQHAQLNHLHLHKYHSKFHGVTKSLDQRRNRCKPWHVQIWHNSKRIYYSRFATELEAAHAYDAYVIAHKLSNLLNFPAPICLFI